MHAAHGDLVTGGGRTLAELKAEMLPGFSYSGWNGLSAPKGTDPAIIKKLHQLMITAVTSPETRKEFELQASEVKMSGPEEFRTFIQSEMSTSAKLVKLGGLKAE